MCDDKFRLIALKKKKKGLETLKNKSKKSARKTKGNYLIVEPSAVR
jgi:phage terminase large subunit-like protein